MLVNVSMDRMGNIVASPVSERIRRKFAAHLQEVYTPKADGTAFFQEGGPAGEFLEDCTPAQRRDIDGGYNVRMRVDPWTYGHWLGWGAHTVAERGI